jgi:hypothetical protein
MNHEREAILARAKAAYVTVSDGRGCVLATETDCYIVTAAHCLQPPLPEAFPGGHDDRYRDLIGPLDGAATVSASCLFVDSVADLAVLCSPDGQRFYDESNAFDLFIDSCHELIVGTVSNPCDAWLLTLNGSWEHCTVSHFLNRSLTIIGAKDGIVAGTSGSPVLGADGRALGVVSLGCDVNDGRAARKVIHSPLRK